MKIKLLSESPLFKGNSEEEIEHMLQCLRAEEKRYCKNETIYRSGEEITSIGFVEYGSVIVENNDVWGNRTVMDKIMPGEIFGETYACATGQKLQVDVIASDDTEILFLDVSRISQTCSNACAFHNQLIKNLLDLIAKKNLHLSRKIINTSSRSLRDRLLSFLSYEAKSNNSLDFEIKFDRQALADYLRVDRSAMSAELSKMQKDGLIRYKKNHFVILEEGTVKDYFY